MSLLRTYPSKSGVKLPQEKIKMYPRKWTDERVQNPDMKTIRVHRIPFCGQVRAKTLNSGQIGCEKLDSAETDVYNCIIKEG